MYFKGVIFINYRKYPVPLVTFESQLFCNNKNKADVVKAKHIFLYLTYVYSIIAFPKSLF